jgi:MFS family permease
VAYFRNTVVNLLNLHYAIFAIVMTGAGAFYCVFLLKSGVPMPGVLAAMATILLTRFVVRPIVPALAARFGLRRLLIAGTVFVAIQMLLLARVHGIGPNLYLLIAVSAFGDAIYWSSYHAYFAALGDHAHRGHQVSAREAIVAVVGVVSPAATGWLLVALGPWVAFGAASAATLAAIAPLLWTPDIAVAPRVPGAWQAARFGVTMFVIDGWIQSGFVFTWQVALFVSLKQSFLNFGGALALAALVGAGAGLILGRRIDLGGGRRAALIAAFAMAAVMVLRAAASGAPAFAVAANALASAAACLYTPTMMTAVYNQAKRSPCVLRFHVATEGGWDIGGASGSLIAAALLYRGAPISLVLLLPLLGLAAWLIQLRLYYAQAPPRAPLRQSP